MTFVDENGKKVYVERIKELCSGNIILLSDLRVQMLTRSFCNVEQIESLLVSCTHLMNKEPTLAIFLLKAPTEMLKTFDSVAHQLALRASPNFASIQREVHVRITELPLHVSLRDLRLASSQFNLSQLYAAAYHVQFIQTRTCQHIGARVRGGHAPHRGVSSAKIRQV
jgi:DNA replicative helicase MCM subunit Mcm2 (Cdc46/Mcm family)